MPPPTDPLSDLLRTWRHEPPPAPDFALNVWQRVTARPAPAGLPRWIWPLAASLAIAAGSGAAIGINHQRQDEIMAARYVRAVDPLEMTSP